MMVGDVLADRYELEELVGTGGMSSVYRAHDRVLDRRVALKVLHQHYRDEDEYVERFRREARTVAALSHPNIVTVIDRGEHEGHQFIVFEYVDGENLKAADRARRARCRSSGRSSSRSRSRAGSPPPTSSGLVHRDVKPQNVLLNGNGEAKVTDFGIARELDVQHGMTQTGTVLGTSDYISPEQARGPARRRADRRLLARRRALRAADRRGAVQRATTSSRSRCSTSTTRRRRARAAPRGAAARRRRGRPRARQGPARPVRRRWPSFRRELEACLAEDRAEAATRPPTRRSSSAADVRSAATALAVRGAAPQRARSRAAGVAGSRLASLLIVAGLVVLAVALAIALTRRTTAAATTATRRRRPAEAGRRSIARRRRIDPPPATATEHDAEAPRATDGNDATYWQTEGYRDPRRRASASPASASSSTPASRSRCTASP